MMTEQAQQQSTMKKQETKKVDLSLLTQEGIKSLRVNDPFLYHSIPAVERARLSFNNIDHASLVENFQAQPNAAVISRKSRLSTECHFSTAIEDFLGLNDEALLDLLELND